MILDEPRYLEVAERAAQLLVDLHLDDDGRLRRVSRGGIVGAPGRGAGGLCGGRRRLPDACSERPATSVWFERGRDLVEQALEHFADGDGGYFDTPDDGEALIKRPQDPADNATPSGQSLLATVLVSLAATDRRGALPRPRDDAGQPARRASPSGRRGSRRRRCRRWRRWVTGRGSSQWWATMRAIGAS